MLKTPVATVIYSGDDTWADNIKKTLKEACGDDDKRQVVDFMQEKAC